MDPVNMLDEGVGHQKGREEAQLGGDQGRVGCKVKTPEGHQMEISLSPEWCHPVGRNAKFALKLKC